MHAKFTCAIIQPLSSFSIYPSLGHLCAFLGHAVSRLRTAPKFHPGLSLPIGCPNIHPIPALDLQLSGPRLWRFHWEKSDLKGRTAHVRGKYEQPGCRACRPKMPTDTSTRNAKVLVPNGGTGRPAAIRVMARRHHGSGHLVKSPRQPVKFGQAPELPQNPNPGESQTRPPDPAKCIVA